MSKREQVIETATKLFCQYGYHATSVDLIAEQAGVTKRTLYKHFCTKDELILASLRQYDSKFRNDFMRRVEAAAPTPRERLLAIFDVAEGWFQDKYFFGCVFIKAVGEFPEPELPVRQAAQAFKNLMRDYFYDLAQQAKVKSPKALADRLALLLEGAIATAQVGANPDSARTARSIAAVLIEADRSDS